MSRHEIRLRRKRLTARGTERFRNYDAVLKSHEESQRLKKILKVFTLFAVILILIMLIIIIFRWEKRMTIKSKKENSEAIQLKEGVDQKSHSVITALPLHAGAEALA